MGEVRVSKKQLVTASDLINQYTSHTVLFEYKDDGVYATIDGVKDEAPSGNNKIYHRITPMISEAVQIRMQDKEYRANSGPCSPEAYTNAYVKAYNKTHYDVLTISSMPKGMKDRIKKVAESKGMTVPRYIISLFEADEAAMPAQAES